LLSRAGEFFLTNKGHDPLRFASARAAVLRQFSCRVADMPRRRYIFGNAVAQSSISDRAKGGVDADRPRVISP